MTVQVTMETDYHIMPYKALLYNTLYRPGLLLSLCNLLSLLDSSLPHSRDMVYSIACCGRFPFRISMAASLLEPLDRHPEAAPSPVAIQLIACYEPLQLRRRQQHLIQLCVPYHCLHQMHTLLASKTL